MAWRFPFPSAAAVPATEYDDARPLHHGVMYESPVLDVVVLAEFPLHSTEKRVGETAGEAGDATSLRYSQTSLRYSQVSYRCVFFLGKKKSPTATGVGSFVAAGLGRSRFFFNLGRSS